MNCTWNALSSCITGIARFRLRHKDKRILAKDKKLFENNIYSFNLRLSMKIQNIHLFLRHYYNFPSFACP